MPQPPRLGPRRAVRVRIYDGSHEVLHKFDIIHMVDLDSPMLPAMLPAFLAQGVELARTLENEVLKSPRLELWCEVSNTKLRDYFGGLL